MSETHTILIVMYIIYFIFTLSFRDIGSHISISEASIYDQEFILYITVAIIVRVNVCTGGNVVCFGCKSGPY